MGHSKIQTTKQASILKAMNQAVTRLYVQDADPGQPREQAA
jgi:hypothetical protein